MGAIEDKRGLRSRRFSAGRVLVAKQPLNLAVTELGEEGAADDPLIGANRRAVNHANELEMSEIAAAIVQCQPERGARLDGVIQD